MKWIAGVVLLLSMTVSLRADVRWNLTTLDFRTQPINLLSIDANSVRYIDKQSAEQTVPLDQFVGLQEASPPAQRPKAKLALILADGAKLAGDVASLKDENLIFTSSLVGELSFPLKQVVRIESTKSSGGRLPDRSKTEDILQLANGDSVHGVVEAISPTAVSIKTDAGPSDVPIESIAAVVFADSGAAVDRKTKGFRVQLDEGSNLFVDALAVQGSGASLTLPGGLVRTIDLDKLTSIEQINGPVCWLSLLAPSENVQTPFLEVSWPARMNTSVAGEPIKFGSQTFTHGIGVHSRSHLSWTLDGTYKSFRTQYAVDGNLPYADMDVRISIDGKVVHEAKSVKANMLSNVLSFDLNGAKSISLDVDFGGGYDVQDRLNWIEPALLRTATPATTEPATQP